MTNIPTLLLIDDNPSHAAIFQEALLSSADGPFEGDWVRTLADGIARWRKEKVWAIFVHLSLPDSQGLATFERLALAFPGVPTLVVGGLADKNIASEAMRRGAKDYLLDDHFDVYSVDRAIRNMAEREAAAEALFTEKERAQVTLNSIGDAVLSTDMDGNVTYLNVVAERMTGWNRSEAAGKPLHEIFNIIDGDTREPSPNPLLAAIEGDRTMGLIPHCVLVRRDGHESNIKDSAAPIHDRQGMVTGGVIVFHDVSEAKAMELEMSHLAQHDMLTNLPNRVLLMDRLGQSIEASHRNGTRLAVLFLDFDGFKHINDSLGHAIGDKLLQSIASRLLGCIRTSDTVSRQGGDEFVIILTEIAHARDAGFKAKKILESLTAPHEVDQYRLSITASIGITTYPDDGHDSDILIKNADLAMYKAKEKGPNNFQFFEHAMNVRAMERQSIEASLHRALERNEFLLHYQPKVDLKTEEITGVEALLRWPHPERGLLCPRQFISVAEDCGLMLPIGRWVLREACRQAKAWQKAGLRPINMAVNVSSIEFRNDDFLEGVTTILADTGLQPRYLEFELTESVLMRYADFTVQALQKLKAMGVRLAIDDFGTGYSSLSYLRQFPIDTLKVDQSFTQEIAANTGDATIITAVINMSRGLKHRVIAEGVETFSQLEFLQAHGCDEGQGFYFSRPVPAPQFAKLLEAGTLSAVLPARSAQLG